MARQRKVEVEGVELSINSTITPMLDLAFQVLLFFILTYHPSQLEALMDMNLPDAGEKASADTPKESLPGEPAKLDTQVTVFVKARRDAKNLGGIDMVSVQDNENPKGKEVDLKKGGEEVDLGKLEKYLRDVRRGLSNQDDIKIQAEKALKCMYLIQVMDICKKAGFKDVGFGPPPDLAPGGK
jgi:biopolymer transport protein ExbD